MAVATEMDDRPTPPSALELSGAAERAEWTAVLARLTDGFVRSIPAGGSPAAAHLPGARADDPVPSIEGFARMSVAWAAWLHEPSNGPTLEHDGRRHDVASLLARGLADATDPRHPAWWGPIGDRDQRIVEAAEIATAVWLGGERLDAALRSLHAAAPGRVLDWLAQVDGRDLWPDNWILFPVLPALLRRAAGRAIDEPAIDAALDWMDAHAAGDGWYRDGAGHALDLYTGWAIHWHLLWWAEIDGARRPRLRDAVVRRARTWLAGVAPLFARDGSFPLFGRSLGYRFALAAPFAQAALLGIDPLEAGVARRLAGGVLRRALDLGATDPATNWFRVGVGGERPEVVEGYVSAGASAWAAHAFVALAMPSTHPFWSAPSAPLPADAGRSGLLASADAGILATWSGTTGETRLFNARIGHPADIADHDYAATYGKLVYRSAFPFDVPVVSGAPAGADSAVVAIDADGTVHHRNESLSGSAGPGWIRSRYRLPTRPPLAVETVVPVLDDIECRVTFVPGGRGSSAVRFRDSPATIGVRPGGRALERTELTELTANGVAVTDGGRTVAVRALLGYDEATWIEPDAGRRNLIDDDAVHPVVQEGTPSSRARILASASIATSQSVDAGALLADISAAIDDRDPRVVRVRWADGDAIIAFGPGHPSAVEVAGFVIRGPALRVVRVDGDGSSISGEAVGSVTGVVTFDRPTIAALARVEGGIEVTTTTGFRLDPAWAGPRLTSLATRMGVGPWREEAELEESGVVPSSVVRRLQRQLGTRLVTLGLATRR